MKNKKQFRTLLCILSFLFLSISLLLWKGNKENLSIALPFFLLSMVLNISSIFILSKQDKKRERNELNDERIIMIRNNAHAKTNNFMIFIELFIAIIFVFLKLPEITILISTLAVLKIVILFIFFNKLEKEL